MGKTETVYTRIEPTLKSDVEKVLLNLGMTPSDAINVFFKQIVLQRGIPFEIKMPRMTKEEARAELEYELSLSDKDFRDGNYLTIKESKAKLGLI